MPEPVLWTIETSLKTALDNIDGTGTYFYNLTSIYGDTAYDNFPGDYASLGLSDVQREADETQGKYYWRATFDVSVHVAPVSGREPQQQMIQAWSDVQTAVMADPNRTVSAVKYAIDTQVLSPRLIDGTDHRIGVTVPVEVYYRNSITDPTSL